MAEICFGVVRGCESNSACEHSSHASRRRRMEIGQLKFTAGLVSKENETVSAVEEPMFPLLPREKHCRKAAKDRLIDGRRVRPDDGHVSDDSLEAPVYTIDSTIPSPGNNNHPRFGVASVCGRRRDMEDAVAIHPDFCDTGDDHASLRLHYFGVYDGHGCSHVSMRCSERLHKLVREEVERKADQQSAAEWRSALVRSFDQMDKEVTAWNAEAVGDANCRCQLQAPNCDAVGSTAVTAIVTPDKIVIANCGDSRAVLCRGGKAVALSSDHKPDRPDELNRIEEAGGRVIFWNGARVLGVLAMSRAIGDNYLKPYVSCEPEVTVVDRTPEDDFLVLGSDGLWDVVSNQTACGVAQMCLRDKARPTLDTETTAGTSLTATSKSDEACSDASLLLTKLALARHSTDNVSIIVVNLRDPTTS